MKRFIIIATFILESVLVYSQEYKFNHYELENEVTGRKEIINSTLTLSTNEDPLFNADSLFLNQPVKDITEKKQFKIIKHYKFKRMGMDAEAFFVADNETKTTITFIIIDKMDSPTDALIVKTLSISFNQLQ